MQFPFNCERLLSADGDGFAVLDARKYHGAVPTRSGVHLNDEVARIIDEMGRASSLSQGLKNIITTSSKFLTSDNRIYFRVSGKQMIGLLKVGVKKLFIRTDMGQIKEISPLCVLDFYVHESAQRAGQGRAIFDLMLKKEGVSPEKLAYDRPSSKLMGFLRKHFNLSRHVPQNNNFVVFSAYFEGGLRPAASSSSYTSSARGHSYAAPVTVNKDTFASLGLQITGTGRKEYDLSQAAPPSVPPRVKQESSMPPPSYSAVETPSQMPPKAKVAPFYLGREEMKKPYAQKQLQYGGGFNAIGGGRREEVKIKEMDAKIGRTEIEIERCEKEIKALQMKSEALRPRFEEERPEVSVKSGPTPGGFDMLYNKRMGYATVYGSAAAQKQAMKNDFAQQMKKQMHYGARPPWATYSTSVPTHSMYPTQSSSYGAYFRKN